MKKLIILILMFLALVGTAQAITLENVSFTSGSSNSTISFTKSINTSNITIGTDYINFDDFTFADGDNFTIENNSIVNSLDNLNWSEANTTIDSIDFLHYFRFDYNSTLLSNWSFGTFSTLTNELTLFFTALGNEESKNFFGFNFSYSDSNNITYNISQATIIMEFYDITDYTLISSQNITIEIIGSSYSNIFTTSTGYLNITSLLLRDETYNVIVSTPDFETTTTAFTFTNQEELNVNVYMTPLEVNDTIIADIIINVVDDYQSPLKGLNVIQYVWDSGASEYVQNNLKATDYNGQTSFKVFLNTKLYNFCAEYLGVLYCEEDLSININTQEITIEVPISEIAVFDDPSILDVDFSYSLTNTSVEILGINYTSVTFTYNNLELDIDEYCLKIYEISNLKRTLVANQCSSLHSTGLSINVIENSSKNYVAVATIQLGDNIREIDELFLYAEFQLQEALEDYGFIKIILLAVVGFLIGIAVHKKVHNILIAHLGLPIVFLLFSIFFPEYISFESVVLVALTNWFAWKIATKKDDLNKDAKFGTLTSVLALYMIFIFGLFTALTEMDNKGYLDEYGEVILSNIADDNSYFDTFIDTTSDNLKDKRSDANTGAWDLITGIFLKTLEFVDVFFSVLSNLFSIATNMALIIGIKNAFLLKFIKVLDFIVVAYVIKLYFDEAFK